MRVINLFGGPGIGKSTLRAELFAILKKQHYKVEEVYEYAKDMVHEDRMNILEDQLYILAKQNRRLLRIKDTYDIAICDCPLALSLYYGKNESDSFKEVVLEKFNSYDNINIFLDRTVPYQPEGRTQTEEESIAIDADLRDLLDYNCIPYYNVTPDNAVELVTKILSNAGVEREYKFLVRLSELDAMDTLSFVDSSIIRQHYVDGVRYRMVSDCGERVYYRTVKTKIDTSYNTSTHIEEETEITREEFKDVTASNTPFVRKWRDIACVNGYRLEVDNSFSTKHNFCNDYAIVEIETFDEIANLEDVLGEPIKAINVSTIPEFSNYSIAINGFPIELAKELLP